LKRNQTSGWNTGIQTLKTKKKIKKSNREGEEGVSSVVLENINKKFGTFHAVRNLELEIKEGEFFTFLGPSGCGKTTTLRMIAGFYYPSTGSIKFGGRDVTKVVPEKRNTGMVFQNYALFPHMTVFENVAFGLKVRKMASLQIKQKVNAALKKVRLDSYSNWQVSQLSGGQQQRVALARALVIEPDILLLDEPLSNLDARLRDDMRTEILRLQKEYNITTIYVTHDQTEALSMSDRIAVFNFGECQQIGTPKEIYNQPVNDFVASFIGETNLIPVVMKGRSDKMIKVCWEEQEHCSFLIEPSEMTEAENTEYSLLSLSIRPESIELYVEKKEKENVLEGKVEMVQFTGAAVHLFVKVHSRIIQVLILNNRYMIELKRNETVYLKFPKHALRIVPRLTGGGLHEK
jgi:iron(III) transport system ATP-binding protein